MSGTTERMQSRVPVLIAPPDFAHALSGVRWCKAEDAREGGGGFAGAEEAAVSGELPAQPGHHPP